MQQWVLTQPKTLRLDTFDPQAIDTENNVKVKIEQVLFSQSDYDVYSGKTKCKMPFVMGRNAVGVVSEAAEGTMLQKMDRVVIEPYIPCTACADCNAERYEDCENMRELGINSQGLLGNFVNLPSAILHKLPDALSNEKALFVSYVAMGLNIVDKLRVEKGRHIAVLSSTKVGIIVAQLLAYYQAVPILISDSTEMLAEAKKLGIFYTVDTNEKDVEKEVLMMTGGRMCKEIVYFTNSNYNMHDVYSIAAFNGTICVSGYGNKDSRISVAQIAQKHLNIMGVYNGCGNFPSAINMLVTNTVNVDDMTGDKLDFAKLDVQLAELKPDNLSSRSNIIVID